MDLLWMSRGLMSSEIFRYIVINEYTRGLSWSKYVDVTYSHFGCKREICVLSALQMNDTRPQQRLEPKWAWNSHLPSFLYSASASTPIFPCKSPRTFSSAFTFASKARKFLGWKDEKGLFCAWRESSGLNTEQALRWLSQKAKSWIWSDFCI